MITLYKCVAKSVIASFDIWRCERRIPSVQNDCNHDLDYVPKQQQDHAPMLLSKTRTRNHHEPLDSSPCFNLVSEPCVHIVTKRRKVLVPIDISNVLDKAHVVLSGQ
jgi:hypothetical protein